MQALKDMAASERAVFLLALVAAITTLAALGLVTVDAWTEFVKYLATLFVGSKTVTTAVEVWKDAKTETAAAIAAQPTPAVTASIDVKATPGGTP